MLVPHACPLRAQFSPLLLPVYMLPINVRTTRLETGREQLRIYNRL
jgi:hypothetical protein